MKNTYRSVDGKISEILKFIKLTWFLSVSACYCMSVAVGWQYNTPLRCSLQWKVAVLLLRISYCFVWLWHHCTSIKLFQMNNDVNPLCHPFCEPKARHMITGNYLQIEHLNSIFKLVKISLSEGLPSCLRFGLKSVQVTASLCPLKCLSRVGSSCKERSQQQNQKSGLPVDNTVMKQKQFLWLLRPDLCLLEGNLSTILNSLYIFCQKHDAHWQRIIE